MIKHRTSPAGRTKILLIYPDNDPLSIVPQPLINIEPLGLEHLASGLTQQDVAILDMKLGSQWKKVIQNYQPDIVGLTGTAMHASSILEGASYATLINSNTYTVVGGPHATLAAGEFYHESIDYIVGGQRPDVYRLNRRAISLAKAFKIKPQISPFVKFRFLRIIPKLLALFMSSQKAYRLQFKMRRRV
jgi:hypothetical protein